MVRAYSVLWCSCGERFSLLVTDALALVRVIGYSVSCTEKGKPVESQGRKATGLKGQPRTAEPPDTS